MRLLKILHGAILLLLFARSATAGAYGVPDAVGVPGAAHAVGVPGAGAWALSACGLPVDTPWFAHAAGDGSMPHRASELRVFALYGLHEYSTFSSVSAVSRAVGETASRGAPFDRHTDDPWLGFDKVQHVTFSFLWTLGTQYVAVNKGHFSEARALPISAGFSAAVGLSKEYYDLRSGPPNVFSYRDLVANGVGILLAVGVILL